MHRIGRWALAILGMLILPATGVAAAGPPVHHARVTFVDDTGATIGWGGLIEDRAGRVHVIILARGLTPGLHGIHIHAVGACSPTFAAAGGHFNPLALEHGLHNPNGPHAGDLPNLSVTARGWGLMLGTTDRVTLSDGPLSVFDGDGSAFIIHANTDDQVTDATNGNSGARVACGVIAAR